MTVIINEEEIKKAIEEWADKRAMNFEDLDIKFRHTPTSNAGTYKYEAVIDGVEMRVTQGPYR